MKTIEAIIFDACYDAPIRIGDLAIQLKRQFSAAEVRATVDAMIDRGELASGTELTTNLKPMVTVRVAWLSKAAAYSSAMAARKIQGGVCVCPAYSFDRHQRDVRPQVAA